MAGSGGRREDTLRAERLLDLSGQEVVRACPEEMVFRAERKGLARGNLQRKKCWDLVIDQMLE